VYRVQIGRREVNLHVEQLKLCRATREELRERRRQNRRRMREQRPRSERVGGETDSDDAVSEEEGQERPLYSYAPYERRDRRGMRGQRPRFRQEERETNSGDSAPEEREDGLHYSYVTHDGQFATFATEQNCGVSGNAPTEEETKRQRQEQW
jgi:hypothetical protein